MYCVSNVLKIFLTFYGVKLYFNWNWRASILYVRPIQRRSLCQQRIPWWWHPRECRNMCVECLIFSAWLVGYGGWIYAFNSKLLILESNSVITSLMGLNILCRYNRGVYVMVNREEFTCTSESLTQQARCRISRCPYNWRRMCFKISFTIPVLALLTTGYYN